VSCILFTIVPVPCILCNTLHVARMVKKKECTETATRIAALAIVLSRHFQLETLVHIISINQQTHNKSSLITTIFLPIHSYIMYVLSRNLRFLTKNKNAIFHYFYSNPARSNAMITISNNAPAGTGPFFSSLVNNKPIDSKTTDQEKATQKDTLYLEDLAQLMAEEHELSNAKSRRIVRGVFDWIVENVADHKREIKISGFGKFSNVEAKAKTGRNPSTGELIMIPKRQRVKFTPFQCFKSAVNEDKRG